eukprot:jgi/Chlat1/2345/Chrsp17S02623
MALAALLTPALVGGTQTSSLSGSRLAQRRRRGRVPRSRQAAGSWQAQTGGCSCSAAAAPSKETASSSSSSSAAADASTSVVAAFDTDSIPCCATPASLEDLLLRSRDANGNVAGSRTQPMLVLMRHGASMWNDRGLFTGDVDIPLSAKGVEEAIAGGRAFAGLKFDLVLTSRLSRSKQTAMIAMTQNAAGQVPVHIRGGINGAARYGDKNRQRLLLAAQLALSSAECEMVPLYTDPALNERCYGMLQGLNKERACEIFGKEQVALWRRSTDTSPPGGESLRETSQRVQAFFAATILPRLETGENILLVAHGNVLRGLISRLAGLTEEESLRLQVQTAVPFVFSYNNSQFGQVCVLPPVHDPKTGKPPTERPQGLVSSLKKGDADSLI